MLFSTNLYGHFTVFFAGSSFPKLVNTRDPQDSFLLSVFTHLVISFSLLVLKSIYMLRSQVCISSLVLSPDIYIQLSTGHLHSMLYRHLNINIPQLSSFYVSSFFSSLVNGNSTFPTVQAKLLEVIIAFPIPLIHQQSISKSHWFYLKTQRSN